MTPKQILDSFSETLMQDERILSVRERSLLAAVLQHARSSMNHNRETELAVKSVIASAVGETVAQRAFTVLGGSIVERLLDSSLPGDSTVGRSQEIYADMKTEPQPPREPLRSPGVPATPNDPQPPGVRAPQKAPHGPVRDNPPSPEPQPPGFHPPSPEPQPPGSHPPSPEPQPPGKAPVGTPGDPQPPGMRAPKLPQPARSVHSHEVMQVATAVVDRPTVLPGKCVVLDEFLAPQELQQLTRYTLDHQSDFLASEVVSPVADGGVVDYEHRRSRVLTNLAQHEGLVLQRIKAVLPRVLQTLGMDEFVVAEMEVQVTASNDGDFFHFHSDNGSARVASRYLTFVYFFHHEPQQFRGGELRIHDARLEGGAYISEGGYQTIVPKQNQIVFFPCELLHEITPVTCASRQFADSRFTLNGWLRR